jgi:hypothetical protein
MSDLFGWFTPPDYSWFDLSQDPGQFSWVNGLLRQAGLPTQTVGQGPYRGQGGYWSGPEYAGLQFGTVGGGYDTGKQQDIALRDASGTLLAAQTIEPYGTTLFDKAIQATALSGPIMAAGGVYNWAGAAGAAGAAEGLGTLGTIAPGSGEVAALSSIGEYALPSMSTLASSGGAVGGAAGAVGAGLPAGSVAGTGVQTIGVTAPAWGSGVSTLGTIAPGSGEVAALGTIGTATAPALGNVASVGGSGLTPTLGRSLVDIASGIYGMGLVGDAREASDPFAKYRAGYGEQLAALEANPSSITSRPGWRAGLEGLDRQMAARGYYGSGNMDATRSRYAGDFYTQEASRLAGLAGAGQSPGAGQFQSAQLAGQSLASIGYGLAPWLSSSSPLMKWWGG